MRINSSNSSNSSKSSSSSNPELLVSLCHQFDNASNTAEMTRALFSFISLVRENTLPWQQFSPFARRALTVQRSGLNPRKRITYRGLEQPFYMHLLEINERKYDLLAEVCQGYNFHYPTSVDPNKKLSVGRTSEFGGIVDQWVFSVDLERLLERKDIIALYLLQHNVKGTIQYFTPRKGASSSERDSLGFFQACKSSSQREEVVASARQLLYRDLIQFQLENPSIGSLDRVRIMSNSPLDRSSSVYLAADVCASLVHFEDFSEFRSLSNRYKAEAVKSGQVTGGLIATELCGTTIDDTGISKRSLADRTAGMDEGAIESQSYAHGRYISTSDLCRIIIRGLDIALMSEDEIQSEISNRLRRPDEYETLVSLVLADIRVCPFSKSKRYSSAEIKEKESDCVRSFQQIQYERARREGLELAVQLRQKGTFLDALNGRTSESNQQGQDALAVAANSVTVALNQDPSLLSGSDSTGLVSRVDADGELSQSRGGSEVTTQSTEQDFDSALAAASSVSSRLDRSSPLFGGTDFPELGSLDSDSKKESSHPSPAFN